MTDGLKEPSMVRISGEAWISRRVIMLLSYMHCTLGVNTWMVSGDVGCNRMRSRNRAMYWLGGGAGDVASWLRVGEYMCQSVSGAFNGCAGLIVGCYVMVVRHSAHDRYWVRSW